jgi:hypothetical protein
MGSRDTIGSYIMVGDPANHIHVCSGQPAALFLLPPDESGALTGNLSTQRFFDTPCFGGYLTASGAISGRKAPDGSASGLMDGNVGQGIVALNFGAGCRAKDHRWSLTRIQ